MCQLYTMTSSIVGQRSKWSHDTLHLARSPMMASTEDSAAAILPQEEEKEREEDVKSKLQASDPAPEPHENGTVGDSGRSEEVEGAEAEQQQREPEVEEQLVVEEEDGDRDEQQQQLGPRDEIKVTVTGYQRTADNCTFDVEASFNN